MFPGNITRAQDQRDPETARSGAEPAPDRAELSRRPGDGFRVFESRRDGWPEVVRCRRLGRPGHHPTPENTLDPEHLPELDYAASATNCKPISTSPCNDFRPLDKRLNRDRLVRLGYERTAGQDHTVSFGARVLQFPAAPGQQGYAGKKVEVMPPAQWRVACVAGRSALPPMPGPGRVYGRDGAQMARDASQTGARTIKPPRIYVLGGRAALAAR